jgi:hypothetical protein
VLGTTLDTNLGTRVALNLIKSLLASAEVKASAVLGHDAIVKRMSTVAALYEKRSLEQQTAKAEMGALEQLFELSKLSGEGGVERQALEDRAELLHETIASAVALEPPPKTPKAEKVAKLRPSADETPAKGGSKGGDAKGGAGAKGTPGAKTGAKEAKDAKEAKGGKVPNLADPSKPASIGGENKLVPGRDGRSALQLSGDVAFNLPAGSFNRPDPFTVSLWLQAPEIKERAVVFHRSKAWTDAASRGFELLLEEGRWYSTDRLAASAGSTLALGRVLAVKKGGKFTVGTPYVEGAQVEAVVLAPDHLDPVDNAFRRFGR